MTDEESPSRIYSVLEALNGSGKGKEAFDFVRVLYDLVGITLPDDVELLDNDNNRTAYITNLLVDIENML